MLIYILFCSIFKEVPLSFLLREVGPETCRGPGAEGSQGGWRCFPVLHPELQARAWASDGLPLSLGALPWVALPLTLWQKNSGSLLSQGRGLRVSRSWPRGLKVLQVDALLVSVKDGPRELPAGRGLGS